MIAVTVSAHVIIPNRFYESVGTLRHDSFFTGATDHLGPVPGMQELYEKHRNESVICFMHDDVSIYEPWIERVEKEFEDPDVAIVGLGGAKGIGVRNIYKTRYDITDLQRIGYRSNQTDWMTHGEHETGSCDVAVVDGFFIAARTQFLDYIGGFKWFPYEFHCYDTCLCLMAHRHGWKVRMIGASCTHFGGGTSITKGYTDRCSVRGTTPAREHQEPHKWMYKEFRDVLPLRVK